MLIDFSIGNFRSFGDIQTLSMIASNDDLLEDHLIVDEAILKRKNIRLLRNVVIYGANGSGKSNLCKAIECMCWFVAFSATKLNHGDPIPDIVPFRLKRGLEVQPSSFEVRLLIDGSIFRYGFEATPHQITSEWLYATGSIPRSKEVLLFHREGLQNEFWRFGASFRGNTSDLRKETRESNCLLLSMSAQRNFAQVIKIYEWFKSIQLSIKGTISNDALETFILQALQRGPHQLFSHQHIAEIVQVADPGVAEVHVDFGPKRLGDNDWGMHDDSYKLKFHRRLGNSGELKAFEIEDESSGTRRFLELVSLVELASISGRTVVVDEIDTSLHPLLTRELMSVMSQPSFGEDRAQFIATTHDSNLLDTARLRRDQIWFTEKGPDNQTELYSLYDLDEKPKPGAAIEKQYLASRFGGVPTIGNLRLTIADGVAEFNERRTDSQP